MLRPVVIERYNAIQDTIRGMHTKVASKIHPLLAGGVPWLPRLQQYKDRIDFFTRLVKSKEGIATSRSRLKESGRRLGLLDSLRATPLEAQQSLKAAKHAYYTEAKPRAQPWREFFLQDLLEALEDSKRPGYRT